MEDALAEQTTSMMVDLSLVVVDVELMAEISLIRMRRRIFISRKVLQGRELYGSGNGRMFLCMRAVWGRENLVEEKLTYELCI